jgi:hypothetical protein
MRGRKFHIFIRQNSQSFLTHYLVGECKSRFEIEIGISNRQNAEKNPCLSFCIFCPVFVLFFSFLFKFSKVLDSTFLLILTSKRVLRLQLNRCMVAYSSATAEDQVGKVTPVVLNKVFKKDGQLDPIVKKKMNSQLILNKINSNWDIL